MAEAGKENVFLREKCEKCFVEIIDAMISTRKVFKGTIFLQNSLKIQQAEMKIIYIT